MSDSIPLAPQASDSPQRPGDGADPREQVIVDDFHRIYYGNDRRTWGDTYWLGVQTLKCPLDLWVYQEIIVQTRPDVVIETGTAMGGSALFLASVCELVGSGRVLSIDIVGDDSRPRHPRLRYLTGSSTAAEIVEQVRRDVASAQRTLVILDSDHSRDHVLAELRRYREFVAMGGYLIVEDTNINGHPALPEFGPGPMEAVSDFLLEDPRFVSDRGREKFYMTFNPRGFLQRIA